MNTIIATTVPFMPDKMADTLVGQVEWWIAGFLFAQVFTVAGEIVRFIRRARGGNHAP